MDTHADSGGAHSFLGRLAPVLVIALGFLLPLFFIPSQAIPFALGKSSLLVVIVFALFAYLIIDRLKAGVVSAPFSFLLLSAFFIPVAYLVSSIFSSAPIESLIGSGVETDTAFMVFVLFLSMFVTSLVLSTKNHTFNFFVALFASFLVFSVIEVLRLFIGPSFLSFGIFTAQVGNVLGSWNEVALFAGLISMLSLISLELLPKGGTVRYVLYSAFALSLFLLIVVNFSLAWYIVGLFALALFIYALSYARDLPKEGGTKIGGIPTRVSIPPLVVILLSLFFIILAPSDSRIGSGISNYFGISHVEARPSWDSTVNIARSAISESPFVGVGPNQFSREWIKEKPREVNESIFWNVDFNSGVGFIPSSLVTTGLLGAVAWIIFLGLFLYEGVRLFRKGREDHLTRYLSVASFIGALYLWVVAFFYTPTLPLLSLAFIFTGIFLATLVIDGLVEVRTFRYSAQPSTNFATVLVLILVIIATAASAFFFGQRFASSMFVGRAALAFNVDGDLAKSEAELRRAIAVGFSDVPYRALSQVALLRLNEVASRAGSEPQETTRTNFELYLGGAIQTAQLARDYDPENYQNWLSLGRAYESVVSLKIPGAYENAKSSYEEAKKLNPTSPLIPLTLARLEIANGNNDAARPLIDEARTLKQNYTDAIFLLSQIEVSEGNVDQAIESVEGAAVIAPNDPVVFFQLGFLRYNDRQFSKAVEALEKAVSLQPSYANAKYFLGLSYYQLDRTAEAIEQFEGIQATNTDNQEVKFILENLRSGRAPFTNVQPPLDDTPEQRPSLPISEEEGDL